MRGGCGSSRDVGTSDDAIKGGLEQNAELEIPVETEKEPEMDEESGQDESMEKKKAKNIYNGDEWRFILTEWEESVENAGEGTAYFTMENKKSEGGIHVELDQLKIDYREAAMKTDDSIIDLEAGETKDIVLHFADSGSQSLSESSLIEMFVKLDGVENFSGASEGVWFVLWKDEEADDEKLAALEAAAAAESLKPPVEEAEIYSNNGVTISVVSLDTYVNGNGGMMTLRYTNKDNPDAIPDNRVAGKEIRIGDTVLQTNFVEQSSFLQEGEKHGDDMIMIEFAEESYDLLKEATEVTVVLEVVNYESGRTVIDTPEIKIPINVK